jgi:predicted PolB exonuclease-like 3'-5' exonuclease
LSGKPQGVDGSEVEGFVNDGRIQEVADYCESDVLNTYRIWLLYEVFRGALAGEDRSLLRLRPVYFLAPG